MASEYAFRAGEYAELSIRSNAAVDVRYFVRVRYKTGKIDTIASTTFRTVATWTNESVPAQQAFVDDGVVLNAVVRLDTSSVVKGTAYAGLYITPSPNSGMNVGNLCQGYLHDLHNLNLGDSEQIDFPETVAQIVATLTQANAGGGAIIVDITPAAGNAFEIMWVRGINSGTNGFSLLHIDTSNNTLTNLGIVASAASTVINLPSIGSAATASSNQAYTKEWYVHGTNQLSIQQTVAGAMNDTLAVRVGVRVRGALPTATFARSSNPGDVSVTSGSITFAFIS